MTDFQIIVIGLLAIIAILLALAVWALWSWRRDSLLSRHDDYAIKNDWRG